MGKEEPNAPSHQSSKHLLARPFPSESGPKNGWNLESPESKKAERKDGEMSEVQASASTTPTHY